MNAPITEQNVRAWAQLDPKWQLVRLTDWAAMLEERVAELDPLYQAYPWGRNKVSLFIPKENSDFWKIFLVWAKRLTPRKKV